MEPKQQQPAYIIKKSTPRSDGKFHHKMKANTQTIKMKTKVKKQKQPDREGLTTSTNSQAYTKVLEAHLSPLSEPTTPTKPAELNHC